MAKAALRTPRKALGLKNPIAGLGVSCVLGKTFKGSMLAKLVVFVNQNSQS